MGIVNARGKAYDGGDMTITLLGNQPVNFDSITYGDKQEGQTNNGRNNEVVSYSMGKKSYECALKMGMDEFVAIQNAAPNRDVKKIKPFDIIVVYANDDNQVVIDKITVKFLGMKRGGGTQDMNMMAEPELLCLGIDYNIPA
jgi:hypothetical protein